MTQPAVIRGVRFRDGIDALRYIDTVRYNVFR